MNMLDLAGKKRDSPSARQPPRSITLLAHSARQEMTASGSGWRKAASGCAWLDRNITDMSEYAQTLYWQCGQPRL
jgi:hypothetical protein